MSSTKGDTTQQLFPSMQYTNLTALIIGISSYKYAKDLGAKGVEFAIQDAQAFAHLLKDKLGVCKESIELVLGENATRQRIIEELKTLCTPDKTARGNPIVIFFAGHGIRLPDPEDKYHARNKQMPALAAYDITPKNWFDKSSRVDGIPSRVLSGHLEKIAEARGNNITVILDCCSSAGMDRLGYPVRAIDSNYLPLYDPSADPEISRDSIFRDGDFWTAPSVPNFSHILLAACSEDKKAYEDKEAGHGAFTALLLDYFQGGVTRNMTYKSVIRNLKTLSSRKSGDLQVPHCGPPALSDRFLFSTKSPSAVFVYGETRQGAAQLQYVLAVGGLHGITTGAEFTIYRSTNDTVDNSEPLGEMVASAVGSDDARLSFRDGDQAFDIPMTFFAVQTKWTAYIRVFCNPPGWIDGFVSQKDLLHAGVVTVEDASDADIEILANDTSYYRLNRNAEKEGYVTSTVGQCISDSLPITEAAHYLPNILRCAALFYHRLRQRSADEFAQVSVKLQYTQHAKNGWGHEPTEDFGPIDLTPTSGDSDQTTTLRLPPNEQEHDLTRKFPPIALIIHNADLRQRFFVYVFYFDPSALSIKLWYGPYLAKNRLENAPLLPQGTLRVGCAGSGVKPWQLRLAPKQRVDIGWLKIFLSETPVELETIVQGSPFEKNVTRGQTGGAGGDEELYKATWGARNIALVHSQD